MLLFMVVFVAIDQVTKYLVLDLLKPIGTVEIIPGLLNFSYVENRGAAFGMLQNMTTILSVVTAISCLIILYLLFAYRNHDFLSYAACVLIAAGGIGNLVDRILRGFVVDFISVSFFPPVFNFADCCVTVGVVFALAHLLRLEMRHKKKKDAETDGQTDSHCGAGE